jgi:hypothetical protein
MVGRYSHCGYIVKPHSGTGRPAAVTSGEDAVAVTRAGS